MKALPSSILSKISGKTGNLVFRNTPQGLIANEYFLTPAYVTTAAMTQKNNFRYLANYWKTCVAGVRNNYQRAALTYTFYDRFNQPYTPNAYQLFLYIHLFSFQFYAGIDASPDDYGTITAPVPSTYASIDISSTSWPVGWSGVPSGWYMQEVIKGPHLGNTTVDMAHAVLLVNWIKDTTPVFSYWTKLVAAIGRTPVLGEQYTVFFRLFKPAGSLFSNWSNYTGIVVA